MQLNGEKIRFFGFCVCFWPPLASFNLSRAITDIFCEMPTLFFYNLYDQSPIFCIRFPLVSVQGRFIYTFLFYVQEFELPEVLKIIQLKKDDVEPKKELKLSV